MIIIGIDPGIAIVGYGIVRLQAGKVSPVAYGCIKTPSTMLQSERLNEIFRAMGKILDQYSPVSAGIEKLFFARNTTTAMRVSEARGVILTTLAQRAIPVNEFTPPQVKLSITGDGKADKKGVQKMVALVLGLDHIPKPDDAADALAIAICRANSLSLEGGSRI
ncbi:MAG: crossover junction endodeoxyribonuclease RuvC [Candidatus Wallbacteria bacterium HGW-Wallbacteria-1]|uniref:Crossover junction endodeoxyribonuclease RuvC n=1 Tax=Candidatus Wallbacteria bacterium HGW-Wallbacteria-1 TaxID=2013854 RepID=A0A2N1PQN9_9BACT|nr:MAG: crossover junction endodeoxyribonuclease RuvC [Candidatus Wallbacteria bacterium HGW-Wallbacteria-1]